MKLQIVRKEKRRLHETNMNKTNQTNRQFSKISDNKNLVSQKWLLLVRKQLIEMQRLGGKLIVQRS